MKLGVRLKVALVRMRHGTLLRYWRIGIWCRLHISTTGRMAGHQRTSSLAANVQPILPVMQIFPIKEGIGSILRVRKLGPRVPAIVSVVETCRRLKIPIRDYLCSTLPRLANELRPSAWAGSKLKIHEIWR
jgi:hypothetical protein